MMHNQRWLLAVALIGGVGPVACTKSEPAGRQTASICTHVVEILGQTKGMQAQAHGEVSKCDPTPPRP